MLRRYIAASLVIGVVALAAAGIAYKAAHKLTYTASCVDEVFVRAPATTQGSPGPEFLQFTNNLAATQIALATPQVHQIVTKGQKVNPGEYAKNLRIFPAPGIATFHVQYTDADPKVAKKIANATCDSFVTIMKKQRTDEINRDISEVEARLKVIQEDLAKLTKIPPKRRTPSQNVSIITQQQALRGNAVLIASFKSLPPDNIAMLTPASTAQATQTTSLKKYLVIALLAALLAIFLFVLVGEALAQQPVRSTPGD